MYIWFYAETIANFKCFAIRNQMREKKAEEKDEIVAVVAGKVSPNESMIVCIYRHLSQNS